MIKTELLTESATDVDNVRASLYFLARLPLYQSTKPFILHYDPGHGLPVTNIESEKHEVIIRNMRSHDISYERCGFAYCRMSSATKYEDYDDKHAISTIHFREVETCVRELLGANFVKIIDFAVSLHARSAFIVAVQ